MKYIFAEFDAMHSGFVFPPKDRCDSFLEFGQNEKAE